MTNYGSSGLTFTNNGTVYDADAPSLGGGGGGQPIVKRFGGVPYSVGQLVSREGVQIF